MPEARCACVHIAFTSLRRSVVPGRVELPTSTLSVWRSNQLSYRTGWKAVLPWAIFPEGTPGVTFLTLYRITSATRAKAHKISEPSHSPRTPTSYLGRLQKGGVPAAPSGTATLLRLSPNHQFYPRPVIPVFRHPRLSWLDGRCVQGPGTYSPRHG